MKWFRMIIARIRRNLKVNAAMGAMLAGADARKAVEITSEIDIYCGNGVDSLTFEH